MKHHIRSIIFSGLLMISSEVSAFTTSRTFGTSPSCSVVLNAEKTEFGEITEDLPELDKSWVVAAQQSLSWEKRSNNDDTSAWSNGQYWYSQGHLSENYGFYLKICQRDLGTITPKLLPRAKKKSCNRYHNYSVYNLPL